MFARVIALVVLCAIALPVSAVECLASAHTAQPILVLTRVRSDVDGIASDDLGRALRERIKAGGKYRVLLSDQYEYAVRNRQVDRCTTAFGAEVEIGMSNLDAGAAFGVRGLVTRSDFQAKVRMVLLPDRVTLDEFALTDKANTFIAGKAAGKALARLMENLALAFESRRDGWTSTRMPGLEPAEPVAPVGVKSTP